MSVSAVPVLYEDVVAEHAAFLRAGRLLTRGPEILPTAATIRDSDITQNSFASCIFTR